MEKLTNQAKKTNARDKFFNAIKGGISKMLGIKDEPTQIKNGVFVVPSELEDGTACYLEVSVAIKSDKFDFEEAKADFEAYIVEREKKEADKKAKKLAKALEKQEKAKAKDTEAEAVTVSDSATPIAPKINNGKNGMVAKSANAKNASVTA